MERVRDVDIVKIGGMRRGGAGAKDVADMLGISQKTLREIIEGDATLLEVFEIDGSAAVYMVERAVFEKAIKGDLKACEMWMKHWGKRVSKGDSVDKEHMKKIGADYARLVERMGL